MKMFDNTTWDELQNLKKGLRMRMEHEAFMEITQPCTDCPSQIPMLQKRLDDVDEEIQRRIYNKYYAPRKDIGKDIMDVLGMAIEARYEGKWHYVLGYDRFDDTLSLMGFDDKDINIFDASSWFHYNDIRIAAEVSEQEYGAEGLTSDTE